MIAYDLPYHGKSLPPIGAEWWRREYRLTKDFLKVYSQGAPPVFKGDLYYFSVDHDLRETARGIDTRKVAVYLLTGEYDWAATPEMSRALAEEIPGAVYRTMERLGHFPMSEDPERFLPYLRPILAEIRRRGTGD